MKRRPVLNEPDDEQRERAAEGVRYVEEAVQETIGVGAEALSQWDGFGWFCRRHLGVDPLTLLSGYELATEDPAAEALAVYPDAKADEARAEERAAHWAGECERRSYT